MKEQNHLKNRLSSNARNLLREALRTSYDLFKIMVPISVLTKLLKETGIVEYFGVALGPVMELVGLPGSMGLVWATAMITNLYGGIAAFASLAQETSLTVAQVTVLTTMMLVAHGLPVELRIAQKAGPRIRAMSTLRIVGALTIGWVLYQIYSHGGFLQTPSVALWSPPPQNPSWLLWMHGEAKKLFSIFLIILALLFLMKVLKRLGVTELLTRLLKPVLISLGIGKEAAPITIIGMTMGLAYGGGLIIQESRSGNFGKRDIFFSLALMSLSHSIIEVTLLMMALGGHQSGVLWGRFLFSFLVIFLLVKLLRNVSEETFDRFLFRTNARNRKLS